MITNITIFQFAYFHSPKYLRFHNFNYCVASFLFSLFSQCYDGASVMSGKDGGVQKLLQDNLKRKIPYFHCLNHLFHLVIIKAIGSVSLVKQLFDMVGIKSRYFFKFFCSHLSNIGFNYQNPYSGETYCQVLPPAQSWTALRRPCPSEIDRNSLGWASARIEVNIRKL